MYYSFPLVIYWILLYSLWPYSFPLVPLAIGLLWYFWRPRRFHFGTRELFVLMTVVALTLVIEYLLLH